MERITKLKFQRKQRGMTQQEVAAIVGVKHPTVSNWEAGIGEPAGSQILMLCAKWDDLDPVDLIGYVDTDIKAEMMQ